MRNVCSKKALGVLGTPVKCFVALGVPGLMCQDVEFCEALKEMLYVSYAS